MSQEVSKRNVSFLLKEVFDIAEIVNHPYYEHIDTEAVDLILDSAQQITDNIARPIAEEMDRNPSDLKGDTVTIHPRVPEYIKTMGQAGLLGATSPLELGGSQLPIIVNTATSLFLAAANNPLGIFTVAINGSASLIVSFGNDELKKTYLPKMFAGEWQGTMCLTEPQAGSSLHYITSTAKPTDEEGKYKISGQKIYISAGDYEGVENVIHLYLAKIEGAPAGTKGISLFVVPKYRLENGELVDNDVKTIGIYHKMGQKGAPAIHLQTGSEDNTYGWLVGAPHQGLSYMFQMMNEARIFTGLASTAISSAAYYASLQYAIERPQGQPLSLKGGDPNLPQTPIINHPDVKRMLMMQKAIVEGALSLVFQGARYADLEHTLQGEEREQYTLLLDFLTPIIKTFPSEYGIESVSLGMQVFGGGGYCEDFPLERLYRDIRITTIYEGTTGIQSIALLGRNITLKGGKAAQAFFTEVAKDREAASIYDDLKKHLDTFDNEVAELQKVTQYLLGFAKQGQTEVFLKDATLYMELFGLVAVAWQWLKQATKAKEALLTKNPQGDDLQFYESKLHTMRFYFTYILPRTAGLRHTLISGETLTVGDQPKEMLV